MTELRSRVPPADAGAPLAAWLARRFTYHDEAAWCAHIAAGRVRRNGGAAEPDAPLAAGDEIAFAPPVAQGAPPPVAILLDDPDFVVVDKPPHFVSHRRSAFAHNAFVPALEARLGSDLEPVHRLDRETSGLLLLAKNGTAAAALQRQFEVGAVVKRYRALVHGAPRADEFTIDAPIGRARSSRVRDRRAVVGPADAGARAASTAVRVRQRFAEQAEVELIPRTGRTHQIRVHLAHRGYPLVGDKLYGQSDEDYLAWVDHLRRGGDPGARVRLMLHASALTFAHPRHGDRVVLQREPPSDFRRALAAFAPSAPAEG